MKQLAIRATRAALPNVDDTDLEDVSTLTGHLGLLSDFRLAGAEMRSLEISGQRLFTGQVSGLRAGRARIEDLRMDSVDFAGCELSQAAFVGGKWSRVRFTECKVLSGQFSDLTFEDVVFDRCKLGFAAFQAVTAKGAVIFRGCSLEEAWFVGCDLSRAAFDDCRLTDTSFERTTCKGTDLRGNDLSRVRGVPCLAQAIIEPAQVIQLGHALVRDLELRLPDD
jgi:uncharacterized protein YjbI with pentapeptide repeats